MATLIGSPLTRSYADLTFSPTGTLYAITGDGSVNPSTLFTIDKATAAATQVVVLGHGDDGEAIAFNSDNNLIYHMSGTNESGQIPPPNMVLETINPASPTTAPVNIPLVGGVAISEATTIVYEGAGRFLWIDLLNVPFPPQTSRLLTMTTGGVPAVRGTLGYTATGIAIVRVFTLTVTVANNGSSTGSVASVPLGVTCGAPTLTCPTPFVGGSQVTLTATPGAGSLFAGWNGACTGTASCVVDVNADKSVTATFTQAAATRTLTVVRTGSGAVTSTPAGTPALDCGTTCAVAFPDGTPVALTATPAAGNSFVAWGGSCNGFGGCSVAMTADRSVSATFGTNQTLIVSKAGTGIGTVTSDRGGISCGATCAATLGQGTVVLLTATAGAGSSFASWSGGGCSGNSATCTVTMSVAQTVTATFNLTATPDYTFGPAPAPQTLTLEETDGSAAFVVTLNGTGGFAGTITLACDRPSLPEGADCTNPAPTPVTLTPDVTGASSGTTTVRINVRFDSNFGMVVWRKNPPWLPLIASLTVLLAAALVANRNRRRVRLRLAVAGSGLVVTLVASCSGGTTSTGQNVDVQDYQVLVTATDNAPRVLPSGAASVDPANGASQSSPAILRSQILRLTVRMVDR